MKRDLKKFAFTNELFEGGDLPFLEVCVWDGEKREIKLLIVIYMVTSKVKQIISYIFVIKLGRFWVSNLVIGI